METDGLPIEYCAHTAHCNSLEIPNMPEDSAFAVGGLLLAALIVLSLFTGSHEHSAAIYTLPMPQ